MKCVTSLGLLLVALIPVSTLGNDSLVTFKGGIGVDPISNVVVSATTPSVFCGPAASATASSTGAVGVPLDVDGDFVIDDVLSPAPGNPCATPVLLIRNAGGTHGWFAAGIPE